MPFTPSHAVVALPFLRTPLTPAAVAVGAMAPDLPLFIRVGVPGYAITHDFTWLPLTVVIALALLLGWRCVLRPAARELSPAWLARRLPEMWDEGARAALKETFPSARGTLLLLVSLAIGIASHILWDLFTHEGRWGVSAIPALAKQWGLLTGFKWLQHGSSVVGLAIIAAWGVLWLRRRMPGALHRVLRRWMRWAWWLSLPLLLLAVLAWGLAVTGPLTGDWTAAHLAYLVLPPACAVWGVGTFILAVLLQVARSRWDVSAR